MKKQKINFRAIKVGRRRVKIKFFDLKGRAVFIKGWETYIKPLKKVKKAPRS